MSRKRPAETAETLGERVRRALEADYELTEGERLLLAQLKDCLDVLEKLSAAVRGLDPTDFVVVGTRGQLAEHPLLQSYRRFIDSLTKLVNALDLPPVGSPPGAEGESKTTRNARKAVNARWAKEKGLAR